jgi:hypothetical protein
MLNFYLNFLETEGGALLAISDHSMPRNRRPAATMALPSRAEHDEGQPLNFLERLAAGGQSGHRQTLQLPMEPDCCGVGAQRIQPRLRAEDHRNDGALGRVWGACASSAIALTRVLLDAVATTAAATGMTLPRADRGRQGTA